jgi:hypothetical protein
VSATVFHHVVVAVAAYVLLVYVVSFVGAFVSDVRITLGRSRYLDGIALQLNLRRLGCFESERAFRARVAAYLRVPSRRGTKPCWIK